jgi:hypothetical protein
LLHGEVVLGDVIWSRGYYNQPDSSSGLVMQAAALVPGGFGTVEWDTEDYRTVNETPGPSFSEVRVRFCTFDQLEPALRAMFLPHVQPILSKLLAKAIPVCPDPPN